MDKPIVAVVQHKLIVSKTLDELLTYYHRFLRIAKTKGSKLAVFPEFGGLATAIPMLPGWRNALLKEAATPKTGFLPKLKGMLAGGAANVMRADLQKSLLMTLEQMPESLFDVYVSVFSELARQYEMTIVAGSLYIYEPEDEAIYHAAYVFGPDGAVLGRQLQVVPDPHTLPNITSGSGWQAIDTPVGRIGILFGSEALYPEPARVLAYQGVDMLFTLAAAKRPATYHKIRQGALARCQENQLYGAAAFLVGPDPFAADDSPPFMGKSAIFAPLDFTPRFTGVMTELGSAQAEGVVTAEWDFPALHELWETSETPVRRVMPLQEVALLSQVYGQALTLESSVRPALSVAEADEDLPALQEGELADETGLAQAAEDAEDELFSVVAPILPTEPPIIALDEGETELEADAGPEELAAVEEDIASDDSEPLVEPIPAPDFVDDVEDRDEVVDLTVDE